MLQEIKRQLYYNRRSYLLWVALTQSAGLLCFLALAIVSFAVPGAYFVPALSGIIVFGSSILYCWIFLISTIGIQFNTALKLGAVRRHFLPATLVITFCFSLLFSFSAYFWSWADSALFSFAGVSSISVFSLPLWALPLISLASTIIGLWSGALWQRYGKVGFWILWTIYMVISLFGGQIGGVIKGETHNMLQRALLPVVQFFNQIFGSVPLLWLPLLAAIAVAAALLHSLFILRKSAVKD